jgi:hypothetical protein
MKPMHPSPGSLPCWSARSMDADGALEPIIDSWVLQGWYKSLISLSGHGDFAEYVVPRADDIVC